MKEYKKSKQNAKRVISLAKDPNHQNEIFRIAKQMVKEIQDIMQSSCLKGVSDKVIAATSSILMLSAGPSLTPAAIL